MPNVAIQQPDKGAGVVTANTKDVLKVECFPDISTMALLARFAMLQVSLVGLKRHSPVFPVNVMAVVSWFGPFAFGVAFATVFGDGV